MASVPVLDTTSVLTGNQHDARFVKIDLLPFVYFSSFLASFCLIFGLPEDLLLSDEAVLEALAAMNRAADTGTADQRNRCFRSYMRIDAMLMLQSVDALSKHIRALCAVWTFSRRIALLAECVLMVSRPAPDERSHRTLSLTCCVCLGVTGIRSRRYPSHGSLDRALCQILRARVRLRAEDRLTPAR